jgi:hypothetical protein
MPSDPTSLTVVEWVTAANKLVMCDDPTEIRRLETLCDCTQDEAVSHFIEGTCWTEDFPEFWGGKGTPHERISALRAAWRAVVDEQGESTDA